jgi:two-component system sensor histidine kinase BaeS
MRCGAADPDFDPDSDFDFDFDRPVHHAGHLLLKEASRMHLSIRLKLFLALLLTGLLVVAGTQAFVFWSLQRGIETLAEERRAQRIEAIAGRLIERHEADGGWQRLGSDKRLWIATLFGRDISARSGEHHRGPSEGARWLRRWLGQPGGWPPRRALLEPEPAGSGVDRRRPPPLELRLMLLDRDGSVVVGRPELVAGSERIPLVADGDTIGQLALLPGPPVTELAELRFRERQHGHLWIIALGMALLAALVAVPLSALLTRPVAAFQQVMRRLAAGDYGARVPRAGRDELGRLGNDLNALAAALELTEQARRRWVADISHELRTPLALLRADLEAMQDGVRRPSPEALSALHDDVLRLGRLVDDLYELSMTDLGALSYRKARVDLAALLAAEVRGHEAAFQEAGLGLRLEPPEPAPCPLDADAQRLSQVFRNLLRNSLSYTEPGGKLRVRLSCQNGRVLIDFQDTSPGVSEEALPRLFERLYRVEGSRSRATGGAGLGLAIASNIVAAHGGRIEARPSPLGGLWIRIALYVDRAPMGPA